MHVELLPDSHRLLHFHSYLHTERAFDWIIRGGTGERTLSSDKMSIKVRAHPVLCFVRQLYVPPRPVSLKSCAGCRYPGAFIFNVPPPHADTAPRAVPLLSAAGGGGGGGKSRSSGSPVQQWRDGVGSGRPSCLPQPAPPPPPHRRAAHRHEK